MDAENQASEPGGEERAPVAEEAATLDRQWREIQHRVRNDLQTMSALWRIASRRVPAEVLVASFPEWLNALSAVYDSVALCPAQSTIPVKDLLTCLRARCDLRAEFVIEYVSQSCLPVQMAVVSALALQSLLSYSARSCDNDSPIRVVVNGESGQTRVETRFRPGQRLAAWPPLGLSLAADAAGAEYATVLDRGNRVATLVIPCP